MNTVTIFGDSSWLQSPTPLSCCHVDNITHNHFILRLRMLELRFSHSFPVSVHICSGTSVSAEVDEVELKDGKKIQPVGVVFPEGNNFPAQRQDEVKPWLLKKKKGQIASVFFSPHEDIFVGGKLKYHTSFNCIYILKLWMSKFAQY